MNKIDNPNKFLIDSGLLFELNRIILHPIGLALAVQIDDEKDEGTTGIIEILDVRNDPEGMVFDEEGYNFGDEKMKKYMEEKGDAFVQGRFDRLGFVIQEKGVK